jgi:formylglycine-generating enzyme required for sulfatase activity
MATRQSVVRWAVVLVAAALLAVPGFGSGASDSQTTGNLTLDLGGGTTMKLVLIPAGKFMMGSPATEKDRDKNEVQHEVTISKPFYMGITHVTVDQFAAFVKDSGYKTDAEKAGWSLGVEIKDGKLML